MLQAVTWFLLAFATALVLTPLCRLASEHLGLVAQPRSDRWHKRPTAVLGGVALTTTVLGLMAFVGSLRPALVLVTGAGLMFVVGLADDVRSFKPSTKLVAEIAVAAFLVFFGYHLNWVESLTVDTLLTLAWIVGITNAFNLLDNMDGLATGLAARRVGWISRLQHQPGVHISRRQREPVPRHQLRDPRAWPRESSERSAERTCRHRRPRVHSADSDLRHPAGDGVTIAVRTNAGGRRS
jgi:hypothetical protein